MNFYCDSGGNIFHVDPERVYQGAANANTIYFIGAFASSCSVTVAFELPNKQWTAPKLLTPVPGMTDKTNELYGFNVWKYVIPRVITEEFGTVSVQFFVYGGADTSKGARVATAKSSFEVSKGVPIVYDDLETEDQETLLTQILSYLQMTLADWQEMKTQFAEVKEAATAATTNADDAKKTAGEAATQVAALTEQMPKKLDKVTDASENKRTYIIEPDGSQSTVPVSQAPLGGAIPLYTSNKQLLAETLGDTNRRARDEDVINRKYLKEKLDVVNEKISQLDGKPEQLLTYNEADKSLTSKGIVYLYNSATKSLTLVCDMVYDAETKSLKIK